MKRLFALLVVAGVCFIACGPSAEEKAKEEKRIADSIALVEAEAAKLAAEAEAAAAAKLAAEAEAEAEAAKLAEEAANAKKPATAAKKTTTTTTAEPAKTEPAPESGKPVKGGGLKQTN